MSMIVVIVGLVALLGAIQYIASNMKNSKRMHQEIGSALQDANHRRFVQQVVADDQLCKVTNFIEGIKGWSLTTPSAPITVKDTNGFVDYSGTGIKGLKWPSSGYDTERPATLPSGERVKGKVKVTGVVFIQPIDRPVMKTEARGKTYYRIPIDVVEKGTFNGKATLFYDKRPGMDEPIKTYIELNPDKLDEVVACYKDVSARSLCLDAGGDYDPTAESGKCLLPFHDPSERVGGGASAKGPSKTPNPGKGKVGDKDYDHRYHRGGKGD